MTLAWKFPYAAGVVGRKEGRKRKKRKKKKERKKGRKEGRKEESKLSKEQYVASLASSDIN